MPMSPGDIVHSWFNVDYASQRYQLHMTYRVKVGTGVKTTIAQLADINDVLKAVTVGSVLDRYLACMPINATIQNINSQRVSPAAARSAYVTNSINAAGEAAGASTGNLAGIITLTTDFSGRNQISNKHIGPLPDGEYNDGLLDAGYVVTLDALATALLTEISTDTAQLVVEPVIWHQPGTTADLLVGRRIGDRTGTMRRRTLRVGE